MSDPVIPPDPSASPSSVPPVTPTVDYGTPPPTATGMFAAPPKPLMPETNPEAKQWGMFAHLSVLLTLVLPSVGHIIGPLIVWLMKKDQHPFVNDQGKESLNFQITMTILALIISPTICIGIGILLLIALAIATLVFAIIGGVKASNGEYYRYPFALRLIK